MTHRAHSSVSDPLKPLTHRPRVGTKDPDLALANKVHPRTHDRHDQRPGLRRGLRRIFDYCATCRERLASDARCRPVGAASSLSQNDSLVLSLLLPKGGCVHPRDGEKFGGTPGTVTGSITLPTPSSLLNSVGAVV